MSERSGKKNSFDKIDIAVIALLVLATLGWGAYFWRVYTKLAPHKRVGVYDIYGIFGDAFGAVTSLLTLLTLLAVGYAIILQRKDLQHQIDELKETREEYKKHFLETTFFSLLKAHREIVDGLHVVSPATHRVESGRNGLNLIAQHFLYRKARRLIISPESQFIEQEKKEIVPFVFEILFVTYSSQMSHYFKNLYNLLRFIVENTGNKSEQAHFSEILRAQLSTDELVLLFYWSLTHYGESFQEYIEKFHLLDDLYAEFLVNPYHVFLNPAVESRYEFEPASMIVKSKLDPHDSFDGRSEGFVTQEEFMAASSGPSSSRTTGYHSVGELHRMHLRAKLLAEVEKLASDFKGHSGSEDGTTQIDSILREYEGSFTQHILNSKILDEEASGKLMDAMRRMIKSASGHRKPAEIRNAIVQFRQYIEKDLL